MANITITNIDERVKQNFDMFCSNTGMNMSAAFSALVHVGTSIAEQRLLLNTTDEVQRREVSAVKKFLTDIAALKDEDSVLTDADWDAMADLRSHTNLTRTFEL